LAKRKEGEGDGDESMVQEIKVKIHLSKKFIDEIYSTD